MKGFLVLIVLVALLSCVLGQDNNRLRIPDFTSRYAEMAAPVPPHVDVQGLVQGLLRSAGVE